MDKINKLKEYIKKSHRIVFFGGAGVSTESGIPDFRSKDGLYEKDLSFYGQHDPEYYLSHTCLCHDPKTFYRFYRDFLDTRAYEPNVTHQVLAKWEKQGKLLGVITQNIDGLHQKAGSQKVYDIHGSATRCYCMKCGKEYTNDRILDSDEKIPRCSCGGPIRPDIVLYEEQLPKKAVNDALDCLHDADMLIVAGTSLSVYPAAGYIYEFTGNHLVVINREPLKNTTLNPDCDLEIISDLGKVFEQLKEERA